MSRRLVLASASPRRRDLMEAAGYRFEILASDLEEELEAGATPEANAERLALAKALSIAPRADDAVVVGADTLVVLGSEILGKPRDVSDARRMLEKLSGSRHRVITAVAVVDAATGRSEVDHATTYLRMKALHGGEIEEYLKTGKSLGKAGAYAYQEGGDRFLEIVEGEADTVVGLPLLLLAELLSRISGGSG